MKAKHNFFIFLLLLFLAGCALNRSVQQKEQQLRENLAIWQNFRLEGIVSLNFSGFSFHKNITLNSNADSLIAVIYDSGIFGSSPKPFARLKIADSLSLQMPFNLELADLPQLTQADLWGGQIKKSDYPEILATHKLEKDGYEINFNSLYQIEEIRLTKSDLQIMATYDLHSLPLVISGYQQKKLLFNLKIDKFTVLNSNMQENL